MIWKISQFPEFDHLDNEQRALVLARVPSGTYVDLIIKCSIVGLFAGGLASGFCPRGWDDAVKAIVFLLAWLLAGAALYLHQLQRIRDAMRRAVADHFRFMRPPFCFECGYDLRALKGDTCPECGKQIGHVVKANA